MSNSYKTPTYVSGNNKYKKTQSTYQKPPPYKPRNGTKDISNGVSMFEKMKNSVKNIQH